MPDAFEEGSCGGKSIILERKVDAALKVLGINKSPGGGKTVMELFQATEPGPVKTLTTLSTNMENKMMAYRLEASLYIPVFKKGDATERSHYRTIALLSHARKVMLKVALSFYLIWSKKCRKFKLDSEKRHSDLIVSTCWIRECSREFQKKASLCLTDAVKPLTVLMMKSYDLL